MTYFIKSIKTNNINDNSKNEVALMTHPEEKPVTKKQKEAAESLLSRLRTVKKTEQPDVQVVIDTPEEDPKIGDVVADGTVYAGISPDTGRPMYTTRKDIMTWTSWNDAMQATDTFEKYGHKDWRLPTKGELNKLFNNRAAIGNFDTSGVFPDGCYWSSAEEIIGAAKYQRFSDGMQFDDYKTRGYSVRFVRG